MTEHGVGESIRQRRTALGMTVKALAERAGVDRGRLAAIEDGASARPSTIGAIEATLGRLEEEMGMDEGQASGQRFIEFDVKGPSEDFHIVVKGPVDDADILKRQVVDIIRAMKEDEDTPRGGS